MGEGIHLHSVPLQPSPRLHPPTVPQVFLGRAEDLPLQCNGCLCLASGSKSHPWIREGSGIKEGTRRQSLGSQHSPGPAHWSPAPSEGHFLLLVTSSDAIAWWFSHQVVSDPMDCSPTGSSVHGILQARILECVVISFSRGSS